MLITNKNSNQAGVQKRTLTKSVRIGPVSFKYISLLLIAALALMFIGAQSQAATKSYEVYGLNNRFEDLEKESERLKSEATRLKAVNQVGFTAQQLNLEPINNRDITYDDASSPTSAP